MNRSSRAKKTGPENAHRSIEKILRDEKAAILESWKNFHAQWLPACGVAGVGTNAKLGEEMFDDLTGIVSDLSRNARKLNRREPRDRGALLVRTGATLPGFIQFIFCCDEALRAHVRNSRAFARLPAAEKRAALKAIEAAFAYLVHREAHSFAEQFRGAADRRQVISGAAAKAAPGSFAIAG